MTFEQLHPDVVEQLPTLTHYVNRSITGRIIEAWTKDDNGEWKDTTLAEQEREAAERELVAAKRELNKLQPEVQDELL